MWPQLAMAAMAAASQNKQAKAAGGGAPSRADLSASSAFDASGWVVSTGGGKAYGAGSGAIPGWAILAAAALLVIVWKKR